MQLAIGGSRLVLLRGDLTEQDADAVVNAANPTLLGGGGVDGAIHARGGPEVLAACRRVRERLGRLLSTGEAVATTGGDLPARLVIHAVGPVFASDPDPDSSLARAYRSSIAVAREEGARSIAFPSISTGAYGFPLERAAGIALGTVADELRSGRARTPEEVRFVLWTAGDLAAYERAAEAL